ncbi:MAG: DUF1579 domain-containing protein [Pedobacter sp.]|nr:MAG: DUF1579 domain-containing protein [Pedobacter sp.]
MKRITLLAVSAMFIFASCNNDAKTEGSTNPDSVSTTTTDGNITKENDDPDAPKPYTRVDSATMMKNWQAYATPGDVHKMIASWDGKWDAEISSWWDANTPPMVSKAVCTNRMILGGRYQETSFTGTMMGQPFEGRGQMAFDNARKEFTSTWTDNMGTGFSVMKGKWDDATKTINLKGKMVDASAGDGVERPMREEYKVVDDNNHMLSMYCYGPDAKEFKAMEIKFTRKK